MIEFSARTDRLLRRGGLAAFALVAVLAPFFFTAYTVGELTLVIVYAVVALALNLLVGFNGQISLGHGAFFALGAYTSAILLAKTGVPGLVTTLIAAVLGFVAGWIVGVPALRLRGNYLALITLAIAVALPPVIRRAADLTGGSQGLSYPKPEAPAFLGLAEDQFLYLLSLAVAAVVFYWAVNLTSGETGRAIRAVRDNEIAARTSGVDLASVKVRVFAFSGMYAAIAGSLYAFAIGFVAPESFGLPLSFAFLAAVVIGGLGTVSGAIFGALFIQYVPRWASEVNEALTGVVYGALLIGAMFALRGGVAGALRLAWGRLVRVGRDGPTTQGGENEAPDEPGGVAAGHAAAGGEPGRMRP